MLEAGSANLVMKTRMDQEKFKRITGVVTKVFYHKKYNNEFLDYEASINQFLDDLSKISTIQANTAILRQIQVQQAFALLFTMPIWLTFVICL